MKTVVKGGKRKTAIATASLRAGRGKVRVNGMLLDFYKPELYRMKIREPLLLAGDIAEQVDIDVKVYGGGFNSRAEAARLAIANTLVEHAKTDKLKETFLKYNRNMLIADVRRKESAKPNRHGQARSKVQKSYR